MDSLDIYSTARPRAQGFSRYDIKRLVDEGQVWRVSRGWYAGPRADEHVVSALKAGARCGCLSGCRLYGLWVPPSREVHIVFGAGGTRPKNRGPNSHTIRRPIPASAVWPMRECLEHVVRFHDTESALVVVDSAIELELLYPEEAAVLLKECGARGRRVWRYVRRSQSGSETRVRFFLARNRVRVREQVYIPGVGRVDLLVGQRLIIECDSAAHHSEISRYREDRRRDLAARDLGYEVIRLSYAQIWYEWEATQRSILAEIRRRRHRGLPRPAR